MKAENFYDLTKEELFTILESSPTNGLSDDEAKERQKILGFNKIDDAQKKSWLKIFLSQFSDLLILVLIAAALVAIILGEIQDTIAILALVFLNAGLGFTQEYRAERAMEALKELTSPNATVIRNGKTKIISSKDLVNGDLIMIEAGNIVPADSRIIENYSLSIDESLLTGESKNIEKNFETIYSSKPLQACDQKNIAFNGTLATSGRAKGVVIRIGMKTEFGRIAGLLKSHQELTTPLQQSINHFAKVLSIIVVALCVIIFIIGILRGENVLLMFMTALSLAVAGIPEALPAVTTISLSIGSKILAKKNSLVRKLSAIETLGAVTTICTDKTGTLTENKMIANEFYIDRQLLTSIPTRALDKNSWSNLIKALALNNEVFQSDKNQFIGDPTEVALLKVALSCGTDKEKLSAIFPRIAELPFTSERAMMSTIHLNQDETLVFTKGAPEKILQRCNKIFFENHITSIETDKIIEISNQMANRGYRVIAVATKKLDKDILKTEMSELEKSLVFIGLIGLIDPPRKEAKAAIETCKKAGVNIVMITGDHPITARSIAYNLKIITEENERIILGEELQNISDPDFQKIVRDVKVYARVIPEQKIRIVQALQAVGEIVAMTGDGINDAPALKNANVGISMGKNGTDVARESSHLVLLDDNFASIMIAIKEGRRIYDNIRKFIRFALTGNSGEIWILFLAPFLGLPTPLLPIQILWINLVTDGLPGIALALEPGEKNIMSRPPRKIKENIFGNGLWQHTLWVGLLMATLTLGVLAWSYKSGSSHWQSMAFTVVTLVQLGHVLTVRSESESFLSLGIKSNIPLILTVTFTFFLHLGTIYIPKLRKIFRTEILSMTELSICISAALFLFTIVEIEKRISHKRRFKKIS